MDAFSNTLNPFKILNFTTFPGPSPPDPLRGGGVIALWWPGVPPEENPPYATGIPYSFLICSYSDGRKFEEKISPWINPLKVLYLYVHICMHLYVRILVNGAFGDL